MIDFTPIIEAIIAVLATIITVKVIPWIKARTTAEQQIKIEAAVKTAVFAAEQIYGAGNGEQKMYYAAKYLRERGYEVDVAQIEAAVLTYFGHIEFIEETTEEVEASDEVEE